MAAVNWGTR